MKDINAPEFSKRCIGCGAPFPIGKQPDGSWIQGTYRKYCTRKCARNNNATRKSTAVHIPCEQCGHEFAVALNRAGSAKFCSIACKSENQKTSFNKLCEQCGNEFLVGKHKGNPIKEARFCSNECRAESQRKERTCAYCGNGFYRTNHSQPKYCSPECFSNASRDREIGDAPNLQRKLSGEWIQHECGHCKKAFRNKKPDSKFCSRKCLYEGLSGPASPHWKGGRFVRADGYVMVWAPDFSSPGKNGMAPEHRVVMEKYLGRPLRSDEQVHHIDGNRGYNDQSNLQLRQGAHGSGVVMRCRTCGSHDLETVPLADSERDKEARRKLEAQHSPDEPAVECQHCGAMYPASELHFCPDEQGRDLDEPPTLF